MGEPRYKLIDSYHVADLTERHKHRIEALLDSAWKVRNDSNKKERLKNQECIYCHYVASGVAGQTLTSQLCGVCSKKMTFPDTNTDYLCGYCAERLKLCKHCGADIELKHRRKPRDFTSLKGYI